MLSSKGYEILEVTAANHCSRFIAQNLLTQVTEEYKGQSGLKKILQTTDFRLVVDTSHPLHETITKMAMEYCLKNKIPYLRYVREEVSLPDSPLLFPVDSWHEAAKKAVEFGNTIFLTTGSYNLDSFMECSQKAGKRLVIRVLPDHQVIKKVQSLGVPPKDIIAMQGPFSKDMNRITFKMYNASVIVTKDSGRTGGTDTKIAAALSLKIPVIIIRRPKLEGVVTETVRTHKEILDRVDQILQN